MKIIFSKLVTTKPEVEVKVNTYKSVYYKVEDARTNGISLYNDMFPTLKDIRLGGPRVRPSFTVEQESSYKLPYTKVDYSEWYEYSNSLEPNTAETAYDIMITGYDYATEEVPQDNDSDDVSPSVYINLWIPKSVMEVNFTGIYEYLLSYENKGIALSNLCYEGTMSECAQISGYSELCPIICSDGIIPDTIAEPQPVAPTLETPSVEAPTFRKVTYELVSAACGTYSISVSEAYQSYYVCIDEYEHYGDDLGIYVPLSNLTYSDYQYRPKDTVTNLDGVMLYKNTGTEDSPVYSISGFVLSNS